MCLFVHTHTHARARARTHTHTQTNNLSAYVSCSQQTLCLLQWIQHSLVEIHKYYTPICAKFPCGVSPSRSWPTFSLQHLFYLYLYPHHLTVGEWTPCAESWNWTPTLPSWHHFSCQIWGKKSSHSCCGQHPASDISAPRTYIWSDNVRISCKFWFHLSPAAHRCKTDF